MNKIGSKGEPKDDCFRNDVIEMLCTVFAKEVVLKTFPKL